MSYQVACGKTFCNPLLIDKVAVLVNDNVGNVVAGLQTYLVK